MAHIIDLQSSWQNAAAQVLMLKAHSPKSTQRLFRVSVVFVARGDTDAILASLTAVLEQNIVRELLVIDCSSSHSFKQTLCEIVKKHPRAFVAAGHPSYSIAKAYSIGLKHVTSRYILLVTAPYVMPKNALITVMKEFSLPKSHPWLIGVESEAKAPFDPFLGLQKHPGFKGKVCQQVDLNHAFSIMPQCVLLPASIIKVLNGFDAQCGNDNALLDLSLRVHIANGGVYTHPILSSAKALKSAKDPQVTVKAAWKSWDYYYRKHFGRSYKKWHRSKLFIKLFLNRLLRRSL